MPKKIDRNTANKLNGLAQQDEKKVINNKSTLIDENEEKNKENIENNNIQVRSYVPGDLTEEKHKLPSHEDLLNTKEPPKLNGFPKVKDDFLQPSPEPEKDISQEVQEFCKLNKEMIDAEYSKPPEKKKEKRLLSPILAAISNFSLAKKLHKENLEHNPLPDCVTDSAYRRLQMQRRKKEPGLILEEKNFATGVGWKGYPGYGPTRCTKLKVYRPKTCGNIRNKELESISSFDKKWRFIRQSKVTPMDLAICWDLTPEDPKDEPERTAHIDGSNGSAAPAVFSLVHTPKSEEEEETPKCDGIRGCGPVFNHSNKGNEEKEYFFHRIKNSPAGSEKSDKVANNQSKNVGHDKLSQESSSGSVKSNGNLNKIRAKSAYDLNAIDKHSLNSKRSSSSSSKSRAKSAYNLNEQSLDNEPHLRQSTPNLNECDKCSEIKSHKKPIKMPNCKLCVACEMKNITLKEKRPKSEYKMAFKAGIPQKNKAKRYDYPEHWRLATVYQHSYKPIQARKRPLLQTVYK